MKRSWIVLSVLLALFPFMNTHAAPTGGLLVSRTSSDKWEMQLIGGDDARRFSGVVESTAAFASVESLGLENADVARLSQPSELSATLEVWPGGSDGVSFSVPSSAELCLRDTGSSGVQIYIGDSLQDAVLANAPVGLTGSDACGSDAVTLDPTTRKYNRGHYVALLRGNSSASVMLASIEPGVKGFMKRYTWKKLEPSQGVYDFSGIQADLALAASYGMQLIIMIEDKTFTDERPTPEYLNSYTLRNRPGGYTVVRWSPYVVTRFKALTKALGGRFDSNSAFEGIATQESAPGFDEATLNANGYTPEKYRDAMIDILNSSAASMPRSRVFWFMNFFPRNQSYIASVADAVAKNGVVMGGPDVMPDDHALSTRTYPFYDQFEGRMPLFGQVEPVCYSHMHESGSFGTKYWTMPELFKYARDNLHVNYMIWVRLPKPSPKDAYDWFDALPVIKSNPTFN